MPLTIEGELVAKSTGTVSTFTLGDRVFHQKFGNGNVTHVDGNKLTIAFDKAGEKRVVDSFVERDLTRFYSANSTQAFACPRVPLSPARLAVAIGRAKAQCAAATPSNSGDG